MAHELRMPAPISAGIKAFLKRFAFNQRHQLEAEREQRPYLAQRSAKCCDSGIWRFALAKPEARS
jgi:hypothetical protein